MRHRDSVAPGTPAHESAPSSPDVAGAAAAAAGRAPSALLKLEDRPIYLQLLKHDLQSPKLVWHGDLTKDFLFYLRLNHPVFAVFCGHPLHTFSRRERRIAFAGTLCLVIGFSCAVTFLLLPFPDLTDVQSFAIGFVVDFVLGFFVSLAGWCFEGCAVCACADGACACCRECLHGCGRRGMVVLLAVSVLFALLSLGFVFGGVELAYPGLPILDIFSVWMVNFGTGLVFGWFLLDLLSMAVHFNNEWHRQRGIWDGESRLKRATRWVDDNCTSRCWLSWVCLSCCCYYKCRTTKSSQRAEGRYPVWTGRIDGEEGSCIVAGAEEKPFAVLWKDYEAYRGEGFEQSQLGEKGGVVPRYADIQLMIAQDLPKSPTSGAVPHAVGSRSPTELQMGANLGGP